jgi:hypothetical protein
MRDKPKFLLAPGLSLRSPITCIAKVVALLERDLVSLAEIVTVLVPSVT